MVLNQYSNRYDIYYFFNRLSAGASGTVWRVECRPKNNPAVSLFRRKRFILDKFIDKIFIYNNAI